MGVGGGYEYLHNKPEGGCLLPFLLLLASGAIAKLTGITWLWWAIPLALFVVYACYMGRDLN